MTPRGGMREGNGFRIGTREITLIEKL